VTVRLSDLPRRLPRMAWWGWVLAGWSIGAAMGAAYVGAMGRGLTRTPAFVPQIDDPLRRGTDLAPPSDAWPLPVDEQPLPAGLWSATRHLGEQTDPDSARYWLSMCARAGADADTLARLWDEWEDQHRRTVIRLHTDPTDTDRQENRP
jgi:hypothetical protein